MATDRPETEETRAYAPDSIRREFEVYLQNLNRDLAIETQIASTPAQHSTNKENRDMIDVSAAWLKTSPNASPESIARRFQLALGFHLKWGPHGPGGAGAIGVREDCRQRWGKPLYYCPSGSSRAYRALRAPHYSYSYSYSQGYC